MRAIRKGVRFVGCEQTLKVKTELFRQVAKFVAYTNSRGAGRLKLLTPIPTIGVN